MLFPDPPTENHLYNTLIAGARQTVAVGEVEFPRRAEIEIHGAKQHMLLVGDRHDLADGAGRPVVLRGNIDPARHVESHLGVGRDVERLGSVRAAERLPEDRIERDVPGSYLLVDDGTQLVGPGVSRELLPGITDLLRNADSDRPRPPFRNA